MGQATYRLRYLKVSGANRTRPPIHIIDSRNGSAPFRASSCVLQLNIERIHRPFVQSMVQLPKNEPSKINRYQSLKYM